MLRSWVGTNQPLRDAASCLPPPSFCPENGTACSQPWRWSVRVVRGCTSKFRFEMCVHARAYVLWWNVYITFSAYSEVISCECDLNSFVSLSGDHKIIRSPNFGLSKTVDGRRIMRTTNTRGCELAGARVNSLKDERLCRRMYVPASLRIVPTFRALRGSEAHTHPTSSARTRMIDFLCNCVDVLSRTMRGAWVYWMDFFVSFVGWT